jgi:hypothetical protein
MASIRTPLFWLVLFLSWDLVYNVYPLISYPWYVKIILDGPLPNQGSCSWMSSLAISSMHNQMAKVLMWCFVIQVSDFQGYLLRTICLCCSMYKATKANCCRTVKCALLNKAWSLALLISFPVCPFQSASPHAVILEPWSGKVHPHSQHKTQWPPLLTLCNASFWKSTVMSVFL